MLVCVVGAGYVGLVTAAGLADRGHRVVCVDVDLARVDDVNRGAVPMFEPGLGELLERNAGRRLTATIDLRAAVVGSDVSLVCVPTPVSGGEIDLGPVRQASRSIGEALREAEAYHVVVVKSTVVPGTTEEVVLPILEEASGRKAGPDFGVAANPEFLTEGRAVQDWTHPDQIVVGGIDEDSLEPVAALYESFRGVPVIRTNPRTAEMIKYASNAMLATMISFANEIANLSASAGVDAMEVVRALHRSRYLTTLASDGGAVTAAISSYLEPGAGFGGSCLPKDVEALIRHGERHGRPMDLLEAVLRVNRRQPEEVLAILRRHLPSLRGARVTVLGLAFRPDTDDTRGSPALPIVERLVAEGAEVTLHDPVARPVPGLSDGVRFQPDLAAALDGAQAVVLVTRWEQYRALPGLLEKLDRPPLVVDGRRMLDRHRFERYDGIGL
jgi:UDPglucose 6-dehydrogenase